MKSITILLLLSTICSGCNLYSKDNAVQPIKQVAKDNPLQFGDETKVFRNIYRYENKEVICYKFVAGVSGSGLSCLKK